VEQTLFTITCTTCQARLNVRSQAAIGTILSCPKCESMVEVVAPADWKSPEEPAPPASPSEPAGTARQPSTLQSSVSTQLAGDVGEENSPLNEGIDLSRMEAVTPGPEAGGVAADSVVRPPKLPQSTVSSGESEVPEEVDRPAEAVAAVAGLAGAIPDSPDAVEPTTPATSPLVARAAWASPAELLFRKWILWAAVPVAGIVIAFGGWAILASRGAPDPVPEPITITPHQPAPDDNAPPVSQEPRPNDERSIARWLPNQTKLVFRMRMVRLADRADFHPLTALAGSDWESSVARLARAFGLKVETIEQLTWSSTDLSAWVDNGIVVIELGERQDATPYLRVGTPVSINLEGSDCRRLDKPDWPHPYAVLDKRTIVTGSETQLRQLADRTEPGLASVPISRFFQKADLKADALFVVDLDAAREAGWKLPGLLMDVWPAGMEGWHAIWELPSGLGITFRADDRAVGNLGLICEARSVAEKTHAALEQLVLAAEKTVSGLAESLTNRVETGQITTDAADRYQMFLEGGLEAVKVSHREVIDETVWVRFDWESDVSNTALAAIDSRGAIRDDWLAAARTADTQRQSRLLTGLGGYEKAEGHFPAGASGGVLLPPETRLSWIATMLPYLGHRDWYPDLEPAYPWNGPQNRPVTQRRLDAVVNPGLGSSKTEAGFPVTHYVGVAGVGANAGRLPADDPKAGVFGFSRSIGPREIPDGASNTLAILGVSDHLGAWASGGASTVRSLTKRPYVNGPDGFGSGQPGGMMVGMADGSVRFISKDMDPTVLEQLATIGGGEKVSVAAFSREPAVPMRPLPDPALPKPEVESPKVEAPMAGSDVRPQEDQPEADPDSPAAVSDPIASNVETRLATMIPKIEIAALPLADAATLLSQVGLVQITFDLETMARLGVKLDEPVTVKRSDSSLTEILESVLGPLGLTYVVEGNQILVTSPQRKENPLRQMRYTVSDLTGTESGSVAELADLAVRLVAPESWRASGGRGTMDSNGGALVVQQTDTVHHELVTFCERLRLARGLPLRSRGDHARFSLSTRPGMAAENLSRPVSLNFREPARLRRIVSDLEEAGGVNIHINWLMLVEEGISAHTTGTLSAHEMPLAEALGQLLQPLGLAYRVISVDTIEITTRKAALAKLDLEFFPVGDLLDKGLAVDSLMEPIKERLAPDTWSDAGGPGVLYFDQLSRCLIVLQPQQTQVSIEILLAGVRAELQRKRQPAEQ
jgi:uncharacterized protein DUF1559